MRLPALLLCGWCALIGAGTAPAHAVEPSLAPRVQAALDTGATQEALSLLEQALATSADVRVAVDVLELAATTFARLGDDAEAARYWDRMARFLEADGQIAEAAAGLRRARDAYRRAGQLATALDRAEQALRLDATLGVSDYASGYSELYRQALIDGEVDLAARFAARARKHGVDTALLQPRTRSLAGDGLERPPSTAANDAREAPGAADAPGNAEAAAGVDPERDNIAATLVTIYYATDRELTGSDVPVEYYGTARSALSVGSAVVSIPPRHRVGVVETPSLWRLEFRPDPRRHVVLHSVSRSQPDALFGQMQRHLIGAGSDEAFVFVHGFNVSFAAAARRTAQLAHDMNFAGLPILYSWPSRASTLEYIADTSAVRHSGRRLLGFLEQVVARSGAERIHLIAHSMGNRALTDALELFALRNPATAPAFDQVVFAAPDVDAGLFAEMVRTIRPIARRMTLYASEQDWALKVSRRLHGNAARAGEGGHALLTIEGLDSVDMSAIGEDMLAHNYYGDTSALGDLLTLMDQNAPPPARCGMEPANPSPAWRYSPDGCAGVLLDLIAPAAGEARASTE